MLYKTNDIKCYYSTITCSKWCLHIIIEHKTSIVANHSIIRVGCVKQIGINICNTDSVIVIIIIIMMIIILYHIVLLSSYEMGRAATRHHNDDFAIIVICRRGNKQERGRRKQRHFRTQTTNRRRHTNTANYRSEAQRFVIVSSIFRAWKKN